MSAADCPVPCNLCGSVDVEEIGTRDRDNRPLRTTICRRCGLVWSNPRPGEEEVRRYYSHQYRLEYKGHATPSLRHIARSGRGALNRYRELAPFLQRGARVLDAGAGGGEVVYVLRKFGVDAMGLEPDERYARHAREVLEVPVDTGFVQDHSYPPGRFDVVTMYHALEHVEDPAAVLTRLRGWLSERGLLLIEVPNVEARCLHPDHRFHFAHFYNFNQVTLDAIARKAGFDLVQAATSSDGGNLIAIYRVAQGTPVAQGFSPVASNTSSVAQGFSPVAGNTSSLDALLAGNYARVRRILRGHTAGRYYSSAAPYVAPLGRLRAFLKDRAASRGRATPREVLDQLIEQT